MGRLKSELLTFCKAQLSAQAATLCDFLATLLLAEVAGWWYVWSSLAGAITGGVVNCVVNYRWVFKPEGLKKGYVALKYLMVWTGSIVLNTLGTYLLTELSGYYFMLSKIVVGLSVSLLWNYQLQRFFVYRDIHMAKRAKKQDTI